MHICGSAESEELHSGDVTGAKNWSEATSFTCLRYQLIIIIIIIIVTIVSTIVVSSSSIWTQVHVDNLTPATRSFLY